MKKLLLALFALPFLAYGATILTPNQIGTTPSSGYILQTTGTSSQWVATSSLGIISSGYDNGYQVYNVKYYGATGNGSTDDTEAFRSAMSAVTSNGGTIYIPCGAYKITSTLTVATTATQFLGAGNCSSIRPNHLSDVFVITKSLFAMQDVSILITATTSRVGSAVFNVQGNQGLLSRVRVVGASTINNGGNVFMNGDSADNWNYYNMNMPGGVTWEYGYKSRASTGTTADTHIVSWMALNTITFSDAGMILDEGVDTFSVVDSNPGPVVLRNSGSNINPRWVQFINDYIEAGVGGVISGVGFDVQAGRYVTYKGYIATSNNAVRVGANATDVNIHDSTFAGIGQEAVVISNGSVNTNIHDNVFEDTSVNADNTYDAVSVGAGTDNFKIAGNQFKTFSATNKPRYLINVAGGVSNNINITNNQFIITPSTDYMMLNGVTGSTPTILGNGNADNYYMRIGNMFTATSSTLFMGTSPNTLTSGSANTGFGVETFTRPSSAVNNSAVGYRALRLLTSGSSNNAFGNVALQILTNGSNNIAMGPSSLANSVTANRNVAIGVSSFVTNDSGSSNIGIGYQTGFQSTGSNNVFVGNESGSSTTAGNNNISIGYNTMLASTTGSNQMNIGNVIFGTSVNATSTIGGNIGIGTTTPSKTLSVVGAITSTGHISSSGVSPNLSSCGTSPSVRGNDNWGEVTVGSVSATGCTITFNQAWTNTPSCTVTNQSMSVVNAMTYTVSTTTLTVSQAGLTGNIINYTCNGINE